MARPGAHRKFYDFTRCPADARENTVHDEEGLGGPGHLVKYVADNIIGAHTVFASPFGPRRVVYCDYIASGRALRFLEEYITEEVLPHYGSTHTTATLTALQTTLFRHEARDIIRNAVRASEHDRVVFTGSGATGSLHKLIHAAGLGVRANSGVPPPVVFVDPHAHHSSLLPWREIGAKVIRIRESPHGFIDRGHLETCLQSHQGQGRRLVGCLAAASNVTGTVADDAGLTILLHRYGAMAIWDYATAAPYVALRMNPVVEGDNNGLAHKDAIFFSVHKFIGGVQTPGVLVAKKSVFERGIPEVCGGGTVFFVSREAHRYLQDVETREEGGTPAIVESVRAGMVLQLKEAITPAYISDRNAQLARRISEFVKTVPQLEALGNVEVCGGGGGGGGNICQDLHHCGGNCDRLPILSFLVRHPNTGLFLHHNFVCAALNDVYGIQARGGCACAGPYAQDVMGLSEGDAQRFEKRLAEDPRLDRSHLRRRQENSDLEVLRPGFVRLNLPYTASDQQIDFILQGVSDICENGWKLLPQYILNPETGEWKHHTNIVYRGRLWLQKVSYAGGKFSYVSHRKDKGRPGQGLGRSTRTRDESTETQDRSKYSLEEDEKQDEEAPDYNQCFKKAKELYDQSAKMAQRRTLADDTILFEGEAAELRWFLLPSEARSLLAPSTTSLSSPCYPRPLFCPVKYPLSDTELMARPDYTWESTGDNLTLGTGMGPVSERVDAVTNPNEAPKTLEVSYLTTGVMSNTSDPLTDNRLKLTKGLGLIARAASKSTDITNEHKEAVGSAILGSKSVSSLNVGELEVNIGRLSVVGDQLAKHGSSSQSGQIEGRNSVVKGKENVRGEVASYLITEKEASTKETETLSETIENVNNKTKPASRKKQNFVCKDLTCFIKRENGGNVDVGSSTGVGEGGDENVIGDINSTTKRAKRKWHPPPKTIFNPTLEAITDFSMIEQGDRVLVCLSGGKDSLSLLHTLRQYQHYARGSQGVSFTLGAATVDPMSTAYDPRPLIPYLASLGVPYLYEQQDILQQAAQLENLASICSFCSRMKRGRLYAAARRAGYNVLAFGQHLDDLAESFLMSVFHNGRLRTMKANYTIKEGDLRVIRPFVYVREKDLRNFAETRKLPVIPENCPACFEAPKERHRVKQVLAQQEVLFPKLYWSLRSALRPVMAIHRTGLESVIFGRNGALAALTTQPEGESGEGDESDDGEGETGPVAEVLFGNNGPLAGLVQSSHKNGDSSSNQKNGDCGGDIGCDDTTLSIETI